jgi:hypothetical protein
MYKLLIFILLCGNAQAAVLGFLQKEHRHGINKHCVYSSANGQYIITKKSYETCPQTIEIKEASDAPRT